ARSAWAGSSAPTSAGRPRALRTAFRIGSGAASFPAISIASCHTSRPPRAACRRSSSAASRTSSTGRSRTRPTGALSSDRPGGCGTSGSTRATASASPPPAAPPGVERRDRWSFRRSDYFEHVGNEARLMRERAGVIDLTPFTKHEVTGPKAEAWLDGLVANKVPSKTGRLALCHALTRRGGIRSEFTITKIDEGHYYVVSAGAAERYDSDYLFKSLPADGLVTLRNITNTRGCFVLAGPRSREVLAQLTDTPLDNASFPWLTAQVIEAGLAVDVYALRVNFVG